MNERMRSGPTGSIFRVRFNMMRIAVCHSETFQGGEGG